MKKSGFILLIAIVGISFGCASLPRHEHLIGEVRRVGPGKESLVCLDGVDAQVGQTVSVFERVCRSQVVQGRWVKRPGSLCELVPKGEAKIMSKISSHDVSILPINEFQLSPGFVVKVVR